MTDTLGTPPTFSPAASSCPVCTGSALVCDYSCLCHGVVIRFTRCSACGLVFQNPRMTPDSVASCYRALDYFGLRGNNSGAAYFDYTTLDWLRERQSRARIRQLRRLTGIHSGRLLDIGCASGFFGKAAKQEGYQVHGLEPDPTLSGFGRTRYGLRIDTCTLEQAALEPNAYDLITLWGTDSHFMDPVDGYTKMAGALRPGGALAMNYQDFSHWIRVLFPGLKRGWNSIYNLTDRAMDILLRRVGLELVHRGLEWQWITLGQALRLVKLRAPNLTWRIPLLVPAVSFRFLVARKPPPA